MHERNAAEERRGDADSGPNAASCHAISERQRKTYDGVPPLRLKMPQAEASSQPSKRRRVTDVVVFRFKQGGES